jgi:small subunit ribosomal protein S9
MPGKGAFLVNQREVDQYFSEEKDRLAVRSPLLATQRVGAYDILVSVHGGGPSGQADAVKLGIARALLKADASLDQALRNGKFLTRDPRMPERKKYGRAGARRSFQFSKR